ncbi:MAG: serine/threonine-protein kinase, partial [Sandaracinaceae bacterium]
MGLRDPEWIGPYRVIHRIGSGGTGATFLALADSSAHASRLLCCVKTPLARWARDPAYLRAFENEAHIASHLDHPNIVRLHDVGVDRGQPYLAYPLIEGLDLGELIASTRDRGQQLAWPLVATIALQMARALEHAHDDRRGSGRLLERPPIIHRDICPSNILIGVSGISYLTDFGIARALEEVSIRPSLNGTGRVMYTAPERLMHGRGYDARADLFSLGVVLYEALVGRPPFPQ